MLHTFTRLHLHWNQFMQFGNTLLRGFHFQEIKKNYENLTIKIA